MTPQDAERSKDIFFPKKYQPDASDEAKQVCQKCPVRPECKAFADHYDIKFGIFGGEDRTLKG